VLTYVGLIHNLKDLGEFKGISDQGGVLSCFRVWELGFRVQVQILEFKV